MKSLGLIITVLAWTIIGLLVWIPFLVRTVFTYTSVLTASLFSSRISMEKVTTAMHKSSTFYIDGFQRIFTSYNKTDFNAVVDRDQDISIEEIVLIGFNIFWSILFWYFVKIFMS